MSTVAHPHSTELQVLKGAWLSVHGTAQRDKGQPGLQVPGRCSVLHCRAREMPNPSLQKMLWQQGQSS